MKSCFEERGGTYTQVGDVLIPDLVIDPQPEGEIGVWGWRRKRYLKEHRTNVESRDNAPYARSPAFLL